MLGDNFKNKEQRAAELLAQHDPMTLAMALLNSTESLSQAYDNGCGNDLDTEKLLNGSLARAEASLEDRSTYIDFARAITDAQQEKILTAMMTTGTLSVHVDQLGETFAAEDVYSNGGEAKGNSGMHGIEADTSKLTIIYCASSED